MSEFLKLKTPEAVFSFSLRTKLNFVTELYEITTHAKHPVHSVYLPKICSSHKGFHHVADISLLLHGGCTPSTPPPCPPPGLPARSLPLLGAKQSLSLSHAKQFSRHLSLMDKALGTPPSTPNVITKYFF